MFEQGFENVVYNCDCLELMKEMVKQGIVVDWMITDPPYGINYTDMTKGGVFVNAEIILKKNGTKNEYQKNILN